MSPCVLLTRPQAESAELAADLERKGYRTEIEPMLIIEFAAEAVDPTGFQAVLVTSANGARALAAATVRRDVILFAVGDATARAASAAGFAAVESAAGASRDLARLVAQRLDPAAGPLLHAAGADVVGDLPQALAEHGFTVERAVLYRARAATALSERCRQRMGDGEIDAVLFFSPRSARTFVSLAAAARLAPACTRLAAVCLSRAVEDAATGAGVAWGAVPVAARPNRAALIEALDGWKLQQFTGSS